MFTLKGCNKRIDKMHERSLSLILNDYESFYDMISTFNKKTIHQRCINVLFTEIFKCLSLIMDLSPDLTIEVFCLRSKPL